MRETCHYLQRGGGDEAALKYGGCISTPNCTDKRVTLLEKVGFYSLEGSDLHHTSTHLLATGQWQFTSIQREVARDILVKSTKLPGDSN